jgi:hypothetical protein
VRREEAEPEHLKIRRTPHLFVYFTLETTTIKMPHGFHCSMVGIATGIRE